MKWNNITLYTTVLFFALLSCQRMEEAAAPIAEGNHELTAWLETAPDTKTMLGEADNEGVYYPFWSAGDKLALYADGLVKPDTYTLAHGAGTPKGVFKGSLYGNHMVAVYPASIQTAAGLDGETLHIELPERQQYAEGSFGSGAFPMVAVAEEGELSFKNLCAVIRIPVKGDEYVSEVTFEAHQPVSGPATVRTDFTGAPELVMADGGGEVVTLRCPSVKIELDTPTDFYIVVPPGLYEGGFSIWIHTFHGWDGFETTKDVLLERSKYYSLPEFEFWGWGEEDFDAVPYNQIWYALGYKNTELLTFAEDAFDRQIVSHVYEDRPGTPDRGLGVITFDGPVTRIGAEAFRSNFKVQNVYLPDCVEYIGDRAFTNSGMTTFRLPANLSAVGGAIFTGCMQLSKFTGDWATKDGHFALLADGLLIGRTHISLPETVTVPEGTKRLNKGVFGGDYNIKHIILPEGVTSLDEEVFNTCTSLEVLTLPASLTSVDGAAILECKAIREFQGDCPLLLDKYTLVNEDGMLVYWAGRDQTDCVIPEGVVDINSHAIYMMPNLKSITFPSTFRNFHHFKGESMLVGCDNVESFFGPKVTDDYHGLVFNEDLVAVTPICPPDYKMSDDEGISRIYWFTFTGNPTLESLRIPASVVYIWPCFQNMPKLKSLYLSPGLTSLGEDPFSGSMALEELYVPAILPPGLEISGKHNTKWGADNLVIYVPTASVESYKRAAGWSNYASRIQGYEFDNTPTYYMSTDYSHDGEVVNLQTATEGNGIELVLMGDGFSDRQIADGTYETVMRKMMAAFFSEEPYTSFQHLFNVNYVNVVSQTEGYSYGGQALGGYFGEGTFTGGDNDTCGEYALRAVPESKMQNTLVIIAMNSKRYAGTAHMYPARVGDYGVGTSYAYFALGTSDEMLAQLVRHEAGGHGFAKLADEYSYQYKGEIPDQEIDRYRGFAQYAWYTNVDFTGDPSQVRWSHFISDNRYRNNGIGCFEGGATYYTGVWRPTNNSIMRYNTGGFNAPSREAIWIRIHKLAYGESWQYDYEDFVEYDAINRRAMSSQSMRRSSVELPEEMLHTPPVVYDGPWQRPRK